MNTLVDAQTVENIINGSRNIDEMRKRINETIKLVKGLTKFCDGGLHDKPYEKGLQFSNGIITWHIVWGGSYSLQFNPKGYFVTCGHSLGSAMPLYDDTRSDKPNYNYVQIVYENLHVFVDGMIKAFPEIEENLKPILKASKVKL
jgi:hypothetical protein